MFPDSISLQGDIGREMAVRDTTVIPGFIIITREDGTPVQYALSEILRAADIPTGLTFLQVQAVTALANLFVVLIRTLIDRKILDESFLENNDLDLDHIIYSIEQMGGSYHDPDIEVSGG
ncbi:hypothetical protein LCGC14_2797380 [marine sediment metagenome]|uniref:Uncharacterized protein n=1 Tax=marine sediment metagenome TaxID=412755 RepID=A0A0F9BF59_9ZZZZ